IRLEDEQVDRTTGLVKREVGAVGPDSDLWRRAKLSFVELLVDHKQPELAETFFNSVSTRALGGTYLRNEFMFVRASMSTEYIPADPPTYRIYLPHGALAETFSQIL